MHAVESNTTGTIRQQRADLLRVLRNDEVFSSLSAATLTDLVDACDIIEARGGTYLSRAGQDVDTLYGVLRGALRLVNHGDDGAETTIREIYRGGVLGTIGMVVERRVPLDVLVVRDSTLMKLTRDRFLALTGNHPDLLRAFVRTMAHNSLDMLGAVAGSARIASTHIGNLALVAASHDEATITTMRAVIAHMLTDSAIAHVDAQRVDRALGANVAESGGMRLTEYLSNIEDDTKALLYECSTQEPGWMSRCIRQSDRLVIFADANAERDAAAALIARESHGAVSREIQLVLVHQEATELPVGTEVWRRDPGLKKIFNVRANVRRDIERVARHLMGRPVGVVLSGGGARGLAHVGALAAIAEAGIPIDSICGTSMGAIFAAGIAQGWSIDYIRKMSAEVFDSRFALYDFTLPVSSLLAGKKIDRLMQKLYRDSDVEDTWIPFFCVSTDLSRAELVVHDHGSLWKSVRASCTIPGIFPPLSMDGRALVDGGLVDNLPLDLLAARCAGPIISVDVFPYGEPAFTRPASRIAGFLRDVRSYLKGEPASPPLFDILIRSTLVGSKSRQQATASLKRVLYLEPPVTPFGMLDWRSHKALFDAGYQHTKQRLQSTDFNASFPSAK